MAHHTQLRRRSWVVLALRVLAVALGLGCRGTAAGGFTHEAYGRVLRAFVKEGRVDYAGLKARPGDLDAYLEQVAAVSGEAFARWPAGERLALLLNLYNAQTLKLVTEHYPVASIRRIGLVPGSAWRRRIVRLGGRVMSLDDLEHGIIRKEYREPRVHFALVCAAKGCPPLRDEPFVAERLEEQLQDQARRFLGDTSKNRFDAATGTLWLSPIFEWFSEDFTAGGGSLPGFVRPLLPAAAGEGPGATAVREVRFTDYDWSLNEQGKP